MITVPAGVRIYLACGVTDMRSGFDGLSRCMAQEVLKQDPFSGAIFRFRGRRGDLVKVLYWDGQGFCLFAKRLEKGRFTWPSHQGRLGDADASADVDVAGRPGVADAHNDVAADGGGMSDEAVTMDSAMRNARRPISLRMPLMPDQLPDDIAELKRCWSRTTRCSRQDAELAAAKNGLVVTRSRSRS